MSTPPETCLASAASHLSPPPRVSWLIVAFTSLASLLGCKGEEGTMTVDLAFGEQGLGCLEAGVSVVDYTLIGTEGVVRTEADVLCGEVAASFIADDTYALEVHAFDAEGLEIYVGTCADLPFEGADVVHRCDVPTAVAPLTVEVRWDLVQDEQSWPGTCWSAGVARYDVVLRDADGDVIFERPGSPCDGPDTLVLDFGSQPLGAYQLDVTGYSDDERPNWVGSCSVRPDASRNNVCDAEDG